MEYKIEKNIPIPSKKYKCKYPFPDMEIGDSFIISENYSREEMNLKCNCARNWANSSNSRYKFTLRKTADNKIRIWRIE